MRYIAIAGIGCIYLSNVHTRSTVFGRPLGTLEAIEERRRHVIEPILDYLRPRGGDGA